MWSDIFDEHFDYLPVLLSVQACFYKIVAKIAKSDLIIVYEWS